VARQGPGRPRRWMVAQDRIRLTGLLRKSPASAGLFYVRRACPIARGCESPVAEMALTTSQEQLRRREAGWEGSWRRSRDPRDTNRIRGGAVWASQHGMAKPVAIKGPLRKCGGCAAKVVGLIPGDLRGCRGMPVQPDRAVRRVGSDGGGQEAAAHRGEVSRGRSTSRDRDGWEGPNAKPSVRTFVLVIMALTAANPAQGSGRRGAG
jgi:hypothetical protein